MDFGPLSFPYSFRAIAYRAIVLFISGQPKSLPPSKGARCTGQLAFDANVAIWKGQLAQKQLWGARRRASFDTS